MDNHSLLLLTSIDRQHSLTCDCITSIFREGQYLEISLYCLQIDFMYRISSSSLLKDATVAFRAQSYNRG